jgi:DHA1 family bicyclomycin/chloramphenicol resistance-like MFS transporter
VPTDSITAVLPPEATAPPARPPSLALLAAITATAFCGLHMVAPALPSLAVVFGCQPSQARLVLTVYFAGIAAGQLVYGTLSDRFGRRPVLLAGLAAFLVGTVLCGLAWSLPALLAGRVLQACGACSGIVLGRAIIGDVYGRDGAARGIALVMMAMTLAPGIAPAIGAAIVEWFDWRAIFALLAVFGAVVLALAAARLGETNALRVPLDPIGMARSYLTLLRSPAFLGFSLCSAFTSASWFVFIAAAPSLLSELMHQLPMAAYMVGNAVTARYARRAGSLSLLLCGLGLSLAAGVLMAVWCFISPTPWALFVPMALSSIGNGMSQPPAIAAGLAVSAHRAGVASGLIGCLQMTVSALGVLPLGLLPPGGAISTVTIVCLAQLSAFALGTVAMKLPRGDSSSGAGVGHGLRAVRPVSEPAEGA